MGEGGPRDSDFLSRFRGQKDSTELFNRNGRQFFVFRYKYF